MTRSSPTAFRRGFGLHILFSILVNFGTGFAYLPSLKWINANTIHVRRFRLPS
jgi:hypothetical protein